jgi:hypothetical protein
MKSCEKKTIARDKYTFVRTRYSSNVKVYVEMAHDHRRPRPAIWTLVAAGWRDVEIAILV